MADIDIAILGGGAAGLCAARLLRAAGVSFVMLEARERLGGRIMTVDKAGQPCEDGFDLGPSWFWPQTQPAIGALVKALGLPAFRQNYVGDVMIERMPRKAAQRYASAGQDQHTMRLVGGTASLVRALAHGVPAEQICLGARVTAMVLLGDGVELTILHEDGRRETLIAAQVIAALPPRLLDAMIDFTPAQEAETVRRWRETPTWMAPHAKFLALYQHPFWRDAGLSGAAQSMVGPMVEIHDASTASGAAALFGFIGLSADDRAAMGDTDLTQACLDQLVRIFGAAARTAQATLVKDWAADPLTATPADRKMGGHPVPRDGVWVTGPWRERLALAGSETSPTEPGYLAGAAVAAHRAVGETCGKLDARRRE